MRKNKMMRAASGLLVATLLTTSVISGTFAKYTTSTNGSDEARVAYWGFNQDANTTIDLFDGTYDNVKSEDGKNVIAPGTTGSANFKFAYTNNDGKNITAPEVAYTLTVNADITGNTTTLDANKNFTWTLSKDGTLVDTYNTVADLKTAIENLAKTNNSNSYEAGTLPDAFTAAGEVYTIGWNWAFEDANKTDAQDVADTTMGNAQSLADVKLVLTITATQVD